MEFKILRKGKEGKKSKTIIERKSAQSYLLVELKPPRDLCCFANRTVSKPL